MKFSKEIMIKAHKMVKDIKGQYPEINYQFQLGLCLSYLIEEGKSMSERVEELMKEMDITEEEAKELEQVEKCYQEEYNENEKINFSLWSKGEYRRVYIACPWRSRTANGHKNYYDLNTKKLQDRYVRL